MTPGASSASTPRTVDALELVAAQYEVSRQTADRDLETFLEQLKRFRLSEEQELA